MYVIVNDLSKPISSYDVRQKQIFSIFLFKKKLKNWAFDQRKILNSQYTKYSKSYIVYTNIYNIFDVRT